MTPPKIILVVAGNYRQFSQWRLRYLAAHPLVSIHRVRYASEWTALKGIRGGVDCVLVGEYAQNNLWHSNDYRYAVAKGYIILRAEEELL